MIDRVRIGDRRGGRAGREARIGRLVQACLRRRWWALALVLAGLTGAGLLAPRSQFSLSITPLIEGHDTAKRKLQEVTEQLPPRFFNFLVIVTWPAPIQAAELRTLERTHRALEDAPEVLSVRSLASVPVVQPGALLPQTFRQAAGDAPAVELARRQPLIHRRLISEDGRSTVFLMFESRATEAQGRDAFPNWLAAFLPKHLGPEPEIRVIGGRVAELARRDYMREDLVLIVVLELLVALVLLPFIFRSVRGVVLPLLAMALALLVNAGLLGGTVGTLGIIELAIPGLIMMIGLSDAIHMVHRFEESLAAGDDRAQAIQHMVQRVGAACLITSITTAIGFLSLLIADHAAIRAFGIKAAVAVMVTFLVTMVVIPLGLAFLPVRGAALPRLPGLRGFSYGGGRWVLAGFAVLMAVAGVGISRVQVDARWLEELPAADPIKRTLAFLEEQFSGRLTLDAVVRGELDSPVALQQLERFQDRMLEFPEIIRAESVRDWLRTATGRMKEPIDVSFVAAGRARLGVVGREYTRHVIDREFRNGRCVFHVKNVGAKRILEIRDAMVELGKELAPALRIEATGYGLMAYEAAQGVAETLLKSLLITLVTITLLICWIYKSVRIGLISIVPNMAPIVIALGVNGWLDIPLRIGIVMIYSLGLGLAVDDTIHLLTRLAQERRRDPTAPLREPILRSLRTAGAALVVTTIVLVAGALCFVPANFQSIHDAGVLLSVIVASALLADLFVLPVLLEKLLG